MWWPILLALLLYSQASFYAVENGQRLLQYDNNKQIASLVNFLTQDNRGRRESPYDEYSAPESNDEYDIDIENAENVLGTTATLMKHREVMKKRVEDHQIVQQSNLTPPLHIANFLTLAVATICMLAVVIGIATGSFYFSIRSQKASVDNYDFTYAPTGPGKSKKKKGGDEGLAYKAQLHHYHQAKQKIISGENGVVTLPDVYESSETSDDENNFSVYECPGLAPTGDIEVQNPNFISQS
ncbi:Protein cab-1 [Dirofilaria immitis]|nr:Protein cab-1 [Dirofilaria immitis]